ncbi:4-azaleucine resistance probable transporter AzlC [Colwellia chukchiensis]|uniref:4-azaleucine resistance probable transporter AzlC n=1 Tax=Colwellia chukchiensis TaxID=641665 RepID=A0A1H7G6J4_9GAMM|nr:AzlC family ABC transporter permease [Colwellia chukchiensis]SEK31375.1 4-azaleucine resistance probable transporter AzlC [Colwellia chukchiensis]
MALSKQKARWLMAQKGFLDMLPLNLAVLPWGILCGSLAIQRDFSVLEAILMPLIVFAGSVQLVSIELIANQTSLLTVLFTSFIISSRHFLYGLALRDKLKKLPSKWRYGIGFLLTDELFALSGHRKACVGQLRLIYALVAGGSFYIFWLLWNIVGVVAGSYLPDLTHLGLDFAIAVTFIALVIPSIINLPVLVTVLCAGVLSVLFKLLQFELDLVAAALIAMYGGYLTDRWLQRRADKNGNVVDKNKTKQGIS